MATNRLVTGVRNQQTFAHPTYLQAWHTSLAVNPIGSVRSATREIRVETAVAAAKVGHSSVGFRFRGSIANENPVLNVDTSTTQRRNLALGSDSGEMIESQCQRKHRCSIVDEHHMQRRCGQTISDSLAPRVIADAYMLKAGSEGYAQLKHTSDVCRQRVFNRTLSEIATCASTCYPVGVFLFSLLMV